MNLIQTQSPDIQNLTVMALISNKMALLQLKYIHSCKINKNIYIFYQQKVIGLA